MAKILTDREMVDIIRRAVHDEAEICCSDAYTHFLEDLGELICTHFGGERGLVGMPDGPDDELGWTCGFHIDVCVPDDGGVFKRYDTDVTWLNGEEVQA